MKKYYLRNCFLNLFTLTTVFFFGRMVRLACALNPSRVRSHGHRPAFPSTCLVRQGFCGWAIEAVISKARSQFVPSRGKNKLTWLLVISTVQFGDTSQDHNSRSTVRLRRLSRTPSSQCHPAPHLCGSLRRIAGEWSDVCGFVKPPKSQSKRLMRKHGAFEINREVLGLRPKDQTCHHEVWAHLSHVNARLVDRARQSASHKRDQSRQLTKKSRSWNPYERMMHMKCTPSGWVARMD